MVLCSKKTQIIVMSNDKHCHIITGCEEQRINLHKHSTNLPSVLLTKYNLQASDTFLRKRQLKNCKHFKYISTKTKETGAYFRTYILKIDPFYCAMHFLFEIILILHLFYFCLK